MRCGFTAPAVFEEGEVCGQPLRRDEGVGNLGVGNRLGTLRIIGSHAVTEAADAATIGNDIVRFGLATEQIVREAIYELEDGPKSPAADLVKLLERRGTLTPLQSGKLMKGDRDGYFLGGYRILYRVAAGTFGRVYRGDDPRTGQIVAVKILRNKHTSDQRRIEHFEREGRLGMSIQHPNIVGIHAVSKDQHTGQYYIVMEFVEGGNLRDILNIRKTIEIDESLRIMEECAAGLAYAYSRGVTHRDIKPTNILLGTDKLAKLVDFGLAEVTQGQTVFTDVKKAGDKDEQMDRTVEYAGLEKCTDVKAGDIRSDVYFLGHVLYEMIAGEALMPRTRDKHIAQQRRRFEDCEIKLRTRAVELGLPPAVTKVIAKAIAFQPMQRFQTPTAFLEGLKAARAELAGGENTRRATGSLSIYVVEENPKLQDVFREKFKQLGFRVLISADAGNALERYQRTPFHALLVDAGTAGRDGVEAYKRVMREAGSTYLDLCGMVILNEDQGEWAKQINDIPGGAAFLRPVGLKQLTMHLRAHLPEFTGGLEESGEGS